jgi:hypothetical protein
VIDVSDPIGTLSYQFLGAAPPFIGCGVDETEDYNGVDLGCAAYPEASCL